MTPAPTRIRIHGRGAIHFWCRIDRIFFHHHPGRDYDRPPNDDCLRLRYNDSGRGSVLVSVSFTLVGGTAGIGSYWQVGGRAAGEARTNVPAATRIALRMYIFPLSSLVIALCSNAEIPLLGS